MRLLANSCIRQHLVTKIKQLQPEAAAPQLLLWNQSYSSSSLHAQTLTNRTGQNTMSHCYNKAPRQMFRRLRVYCIASKEQKMVSTAYIISSNICWLK